MGSRARWLCLPVIWLAFSLGIWRLDAESIWHDEAWSIRAIRDPFETPDDNTPPLYYLTLHMLHRAGAGESPFALRYGSVLIFLLVVGLGYRVGARWYGLVGGVMGGGLLALSPLLWEYAQEVRAYIAVPLFALLLLAGAEALLTRAYNARRGWAFVLLTELAALYTHNLAVPLVGWLDVVMMGIWGWRSLRGEHVSRTRLAVWSAAQGILFLLYLPWLSTQSPSGTSLNTVPTFGGKLSRDLWRGYVLPVVSNPSDLPRSFITLVHGLPLLAALALLSLLWRGRSLRSLLVVSQVVLLPIFSTILLQRASIDFHPRYYILAVPSVVLLLTAGVAALPQKAQLGAALVVFLATVLITQRSLALIVDRPQYQHDDFRGLAQYYAALPEDALILIPYEYEPALQHYYAPKLGIQAKFLPMPLHLSPDEAIERINAAIDEVHPSRIEVLTWYQVPADERGMYGCLLGAVSDRASEVFQTYGLSSTGFFPATPLVFQGLPTTAQFKSPLALAGVQYLAGEAGAVCVRSDWRLEASAPEEYKVAARLFNDFGWEIAASDGLVLRDDQARPDDWQIGDQGSSFALMRLPPCARQGEYGLGLRQYTPQNLSGVDVLGRAGHSVGKTLRLAIQLQSAMCDAVAVPALARDNAANQQLISGQWLTLELLKPFGEALLTVVGEGWSLAKASPSDQGIWWVALQIPPDAEGEARLLLDDIELARYTIQKVERLTSPPPYDLGVDAMLGDQVVLVGASIEQSQFELRVDLVWQSQSVPPKDYTVFVQVLDEAGQVLAQDDAQPVGGSRPTTTWLGGEYLLDSHTINLNGLNYNGQAAIIVGMYDPVTFDRLRLADGSDFVRLPTEITLGK